MTKKPRQTKIKPQSRKAQPVELVEEDLCQVQGGDRSLSDVTFTSTADKSTPRVAK